MLTFIILPVLLAKKNNISIKIVFEENQQLTTSFNNKDCLSIFFTNNILSILPKLLLMTMNKKKGYPSYLFERE